MFSKSISRAVLCLSMRQRYCHVTNFYYSLLVAFISAKGTKPLCLFEFISGQWRLSWGLSVRWMGPVDEPDSRWHFSVLFGPPGSIRDVKGCDESIRIKKKRKWPWIFRKMSLKENMQIDRFCGGFVSEMDLKSIAMEFEMGLQSGFGQFGSSMLP